jgi:quinol monooxygenase YgiN
MDQLQIAARWTIHEGQVEKFKTLIAECVSIVKDKTPDILQYDWFFNDQLRECILLEKYPDSNALIMHLSDIGGDLFGRLLAVAELKVEIFGDPSAELLELISSMNKVIYYFHQGSKLQVSETFASLS